MKLDGLIAAAHTPMLDDFSVNYERVKAQAEHLAKLGVRGVFVGGTTGECQSLTTTPSAGVGNLPTHSCAANPATKPSPIYAASSAT